MKITTMIRIAVLTGSLIALGLMIANPTESRIKESAIKLTSARGSCSAEQVKAPSGVSYILTAAHCRVLETAKGEIMVETESGRKLLRKVLLEDDQSDLLLLEGVPGLQGLDIASSSSIYDPVRTFTHGRGMKTYKTEGNIVQPMHIDIPTSYVESEADEAKCKAVPKNKVITMNLGFFSAKVCALSIDVDVMTAQVVPGSSGGMVVNSSGELVGVVSATDGFFGFAVPLKDIKRFIGNY